MAQPVQHPRQVWNIVRGTWYVSAFLVMSAWLVLPMLPMGRPQLDYPKFIPAILLLVSIGDMLAIIWFKRLVRLRLQSSGVKAIEELIAQIAGMWLIIVVLPLTPVILGSITFLKTRSLSWLTAFAVVGLLGLSLSRPNVEQYSDLVPGARLD